MGLWKKTMVFLGLVEPDEYEDDLDGADEPRVEAPPSIRKISPEELSSVRSPARPLGQVHIVHPYRYDDAQEIGDKLREEVPVIMNLQGVEDDTYKRLLAFASGAAYVLGGELQKLAPRMYLVTPANVSVSAEDRQRLRRGLYNEF